MQRAKRGLTPLDRQSCHLTGQKNAKKAEKMQRKRKKEAKTERIQEPGDRKQDTE